MQTAAAATSGLIMAITWEAKQWKAAEAAGATKGTGTALVAKAASATFFNPSLKATSTTACTASMTYTIPKAAANVEVAAIKTAGIKMASKSYATVVATNGKKDGCKNIAGFTCATSGVPGTAVGAPDAGSVAPAGGVGNFIPNGLGVYQGIAESGKMYMWGVTIKAASAAAAGAAKNDTKKDATTLAVGAAAGLIAAAIA